MGIRVVDIRVIDEFKPLESVNWLLSNIGEKLTIELDIDVEEIFITAREEDIDRILMNVSPSTVNTNNIEDIFYCEQAGAFANFNVGDTLLTTNIGGFGTDFIIYDKIDDQTIRVYQTVIGDVDFTVFAQDTSFVKDAYISVATPFAGITYFYNFIENQDVANYKSLIDDETQRLTTNNADATDTVTNVPMNFEGANSYRIGSATIKGRGIDGTVQKFTITHNTFLTPFFLASQYDDLVNRIAPSYYLGGNSLRFVTNINAGRTLSDPNAIQDVQFAELQGNTGWFNENYNGGDTNYSLKSYSLQRLSDLSSLSALELTSPVEATITIENTTDSPFVFGQTKYTINFVYLPSEESFYQDTITNLAQNFYFDRALQTVGSGAIAGDNNGTNFQVITSTNATLTSASEIEIKATFDLATAAQSLIASRDLKRYAIWITTQNHLDDRDSADKVSLLIDVNDFFIELFKSNLITNTNKFIQHPFTDVADGVTTPDVFPVDDLVSRSDFSIDFTGLENDGIRINTITNQIVLKNPTDPDIILDNTTIDTSASQLENGLVPFIDIDQARVFKVPSDIRKIISIKRNTSLDAGNTYNWYSSYPFMHRWEYWESIGFIDFLPTGIFDPTLPSNGLNHQWHRYTTIAGWTINHRLRFTLEQNGEIFEQIFDSPYNSNPFNNNAQWGNESIISYDIASGNPLLSGSTKLIQGYTDTRIVASFEKLTGDIPVIDDVEIVIWIEVKEIGGISDIRRFSSVYEAGTDTWFKSVDASNKVVKAKVGSVYTGECIVDYTKLPDNAEFTIYARLYDLGTATIPNAKLLESGDLKLLENLDNKILE